MDLSRFRLGLPVWFGVCSIVAVAAWPAAALAQDDGDGDSAAPEADGAAEEEAWEEPDPWERPPKEEEEAPPEQAPPPAQDDEASGDGRNLSFQLLIGYGFSGAKPTNPWGLGFGLRGGYTLDLGLYIGGHVSYFLGTSIESANSGGGTGTIGAASETSLKTIEFAAEVGWDLWISTVVIRPYLGLGAGIHLRESTTSLGTNTGSVGAFAFTPGASVFWAPGMFFVGGDVRFNVLGGDGFSGTSVSALAGLRF
jgi:hypothetical protein